MTQLRTAVCVKHVAVAAPIVADDGTAVVAEGGRFEANEADLGAIEEALAQRTLHGGSVTAVTVGPARAREALAAAGAAGVDDGMHVVGESTDHDRIAQALAGVIGNGGYDLVLAGIQASDDLLGLTGILLAERLGIPAATAVVGLDVDAAANSVVVTRELANGYRQILKASLPCLLTVQLGIRRLRYLPVMALLKARRRPFTELDLGSLAPVSTDPGRIPEPRLLELLAPPNGSHCEILTGPPSATADDLASRLAPKLGYASS